MTTLEPGLLASFGLLLVCLGACVLTPSGGQDEGQLEVEAGVELYWKRLGSGPPLLIPNAVYLERDFSWLAQTHSVVLYDLRNRGRSSHIEDPEVLSRGIHADVDDLERVRQHFGFGRMSVIGHSYVALVAARWSILHPEATERLILIGPPAPDPNEATRYSLEARQDNPELVALAQELQQWMATASAAALAFGTEEATASCIEYWDIFARVLVGDPKNSRLVFEDTYCQFPNEQPLAMLSHISTSIMPSIQNLDFDSSQLASHGTPTLVIHGDRDRNAPIAGGRDWVKQLGNARLWVVPGSGHLPFLEEPTLVRGAIADFLSGVWPTRSESLRSQ